MKLTKEVNIYNEYGESFKSRDLQIRALSEKLMIVASDSEIKKLTDGKITLYSQMSKIEQNAKRIELSVSDVKKTAEGAAEDAVETVKKNVISYISLSSETAKISARKIELEGAITANGTFKINTDGNMVATGGEIAGIKIENNRIVGASADGKLNGYMAGPQYWNGSVFARVTENIGTEENPKWRARSTLYYDGKAEFANLKVDGYGYLNLYSDIKIYDDNEIAIEGDSNPKYAKARVKNSYFAIVNNVEVKRDNYYEYDDGWVAAIYQDSNQNGTVRCVKPQEATTRYAEMRGENISATGNLTIKGKKNRAVDTDGYGTILQYCYEMVSPMFGDIGNGTTDENGICYIYTDDRFRETVGENMKYYVFLQIEGEGNAYIKEKKPEYFVVTGSPNMKFAWEIKCRQKGYDYERLDVFDETSGIEEKQLMTQETWKAMENLAYVSNMTNGLMLQYDDCMDEQERMIDENYN